MTLEPERQQAIDDALLESLLRESFASSSRANEDTRRIDTLLARIHPQPEQLATSQPTASQPVMRGSKKTAYRWLSLAVAAALLIAVGLWTLDNATSSSAYAAVMRSLETVPPTRHYRVHMVHQRPVWGNREATADLYLSDSDRFVIRHPGWARFGDVWIGGDSKNRWFVPRFGPAFTGGEEIVGGWLAKKDIPSPYLHVSTVLERMSRGYHLKTIGREEIAHVDAPNRTSRCQHVRGERRGGNGAGPTQIELWADLDSGIARRLQLTWDRSSSERGPISWTIELMGSPELPPDWFELQGHISSDRTVIPIQSAATLEEVEGDVQ